MDKRDKQSDRRYLKSTVWSVLFVFFMLKWVLPATYISRAEAAVRSGCADDPLDVRGVEPLDVHVDQVLLES